MNVQETWSAPLSDVKVGDLIQRTITRSAGGTLSEFIPETSWDSIAGVSTYPRRAKVKTNKTKTSVYSSRVETVNYLFEQDGEFTLPTIKYMYLNSLNNTFYEKQIDSIVISVKPNADLAMLASIKKSLQKEKNEEEVAEDKAFIIFCYTPLAFAKYVIIGLVVLFIFYHIFKRCITLVQSKHKAYLSSESYAFKKVKNAIKKQDYSSFITSSQSWLRYIDAENNSLIDTANSYS